MSCRTLHIVALGLIAAAGCTYPFTRTATEDADTRQAEKTAHKASTLTAWGDFKATSGFAPENPPAQQQQLREEAKHAYLQAIEVNPNHLSAYLGLGRLQQMNGDPSGALHVYEQALRILPEEPRLWFELGMCHCRAKNWSKAVEGLGKASELDSANRQYSTTLGFALARAGRYEDSYVALARHNGEPKAHYDLARMLCHLDHLDLARQQLTLALQKDPSMAQAQALAADIDARNKQEKEGVRTASHSQPDNPEPGAKPGNIGRPIRLPPLPVIYLHTDEE